MKYIYLILILVAIGMAVLVIWAYIATSQMEELFLKKGLIFKREKKFYEHVSRFTVRKITPAELQEKLASFDFSAVQYYKSPRRILKTVIEVQSAENGQVFYLTAKCEQSNLNPIARMKLYPVSEQESGMPDQSVYRLGFTYVKKCSRCWIMAVAIRLMRNS